MKPVEITYIIIIVTLLIIIIIPKQQESKICFQEKCFEVELAQTQEQWEKGLMFRESLQEEQGMLFIFKKSDIYNFWMKNTLIPLDIIWLNQDLKVVHIETAKPCPPEQDFCQPYTPGKEAKYVLEINSGLAERNNIIIGNKALITPEHSV